MGEVQTTAGPVEAEALGRTMVHEHLNTASDAVRAQFPHLYDAQAERERAIAQTRKAAEHGVETICDPACMDLARDVQLNLHVAEATGVRFVMATGVYGLAYTFLPPYFQNREPAALTDALVHDLEEGIQGTGIRAGFLKCAADAPGLTEDVERIHRAVAQASLRTGAPIMAHSHPATQTGLEQMRVFTEEGVEPQRIQIAHTGDTDDLDYIERLLELGPFIGMDRYGLDIILSTEKRNETIAELCRRGHAERMMLGQDACASIDWYPREMVAQMAPDWHFAFIFERVLGELHELGVSEQQTDNMLGRNVHRWLGGSRS